MPKPPELDLFGSPLRVRRTRVHKVQRDETPPVRELGRGVWMPADETKSFLGWANLKPGIHDEVFVTLNAAGELTRCILTRGGISRRSSVPIRGKPKR